jgi:cholesterol oxidase
MVLHGVGVGGGSLGYCGVLEVPTNETFATPAWNQTLNWGEILRPHYETAKRMLGVARNPKLWNADRVMQSMAEARGNGDTFRATDVGVFFGEAGVKAADPFFGGEGPERVGCIHCGACMVGCRHNAKNTLPKNYLYLAEKNGAEVRAEVEVIDVRPLTMDDGRWTTDGEQPIMVNGLSSMVEDVRYAITYRSSIKLIKQTQTVYARNVIFAAGVIGTMNLLLNLRDVKRSLPNLSLRLGNMVRTNSEALLGSVTRTSDLDYSQGVSISSIYNHDAVTRVEPVRYPNGSSLMRLLAAPLIDLEVGVPARIIRSLWWILTHPFEFLKAEILPGWAHNTTIVLVMQNKDNRMRFRLGRSPYTLFRKGLIAKEEPGYKIHAQVEGSHEIVREFAARTNGVAMGSLGENLLNLPTTAHILGGAPMGKNAEEGVVDENFQVHNYEGMYIIDGSIMPANPGVNPSLTITALAEYAMSKIQRKP